MTEELKHADIEAIMRYVSLVEHDTLTIQSARLLVEEIADLRAKLAEAEAEGAAWKATFEAERNAHEAALTQARADLEAERNQVNRLIEALHDATAEAERETRWRVSADQKLLALTLERDALRNWEHTAREMKKAVDAEAARAERAEAALREARSYLPDGARAPDSVLAAEAIDAYFEPQASTTTAPRSDATHG